MLSVPSRNKYLYIYLHPHSVLYEKGPFQKQPIENLRQISANDQIPMEHGTRLTLGMKVHSGTGVKLFHRNAFYLNIFNMNSLADKGKTRFFRKTLIILSYVY